MASSLKFRLLTASNINSPDVELMVFPSIRILSMLSCPPVITAVPTLIGPKPSAMEPPANAPVEVSDELRILEPNVEAFKTDTLFILKAVLLPQLIRTVNQNNCKQAIN